MSENSTKNSAVTGLGIAGLVCGILTFIGSFVPCFGMFAIFLGFLALILCIIGLVIASKKGASKGLLIAGLVLSIVGCAVAFTQAAAVASIGNDSIEIMEQMQEEMEKQAEEMQKALEEE